MPNSILLQDNPTTQNFRTCFTYPNLGFDLGQVTKLEEAWLRETDPAGKAWLRRSIKSYQLLIRANIAGTVNPRDEATS